MNEHLNQLTDRDLGTIASVLGADLEELVAELEARPWRIHDILSDPELFDVVMDRKDHPAAVISPRLLFSVLMHRAAAELREAVFVNDWLGPRSRLPVFDVDPLREFVGDPGIAPSSGNACQYNGLLFG